MAAHAVGETTQSSLRGPPRQRRSGFLRSRGLLAWCWFVFAIRGSPYLLSMAVEEKTESPMILVRDISGDSLSLIVPNLQLTESIQFPQTEPFFDGDRHSGRHPIVNRPVRQTSWNLRPSDPSCPASILVRSCSLAHTRLRELRGCFPLEENEVYAV